MNDITIEMEAPRAKHLIDHVYADDPAKDEVSEIAQRLAAGVEAMCDMILERVAEARAVLDSLEETVTIKKSSLSKGLADFVTDTHKKLDFVGRINGEFGDIAEKIARQ